MPSMTNIKSVQNKLLKLANRYHTEGQMSVVVGYTANYAVYVHERQARHAPGKQWKFLEQPARQMAGTLGDIVGTSLKHGTKLLQALYLAGMRLQRESQMIVPVKTGNLRGSAFTAKEDELEAVMAASEGQLLGKLQKQGERKVAKKVRRLKKSMRLAGRKKR